MKKTIIYHEINQHEIPCLVDEMRLYDVKPLMNEKGAFECSYRSVSTYELAESIAQKRNAKALEEIKPLTIGYTSKTCILVEWGGERYKCPFIDTYNKPESKSKAKMFKFDLSKIVVKKNISQEERNEKALWCHIMEKLAPNETRSVDELYSSYKTKEKPISLTCLVPKVKRNYKKATFMKEGVRYRKEMGMKEPVKPVVENEQPVKEKEYRPAPWKLIEGKYKYVSKIGDSKWKVQAKYKGKNQHRGVFTNYEEACAAADLLALDIKRRRIV